MEKINLDTLDVRVYGKSQLMINEGQIDKQYFRTFKERKIDMRNIKNDFIKIISFGDSVFKLYV
ncbi:hypothetical protein GTQ40_04360 [Flavobacteriaceae bacterium R38]|nr:hypothetical protein [Flavobacteriaceae bacterium R38]